MRQAPYSLKVPVEEFYNKLGWAECPKCHESFKLGVEPKIVMASDVLCDQCIGCGTYTIINMLDSSVVYIEGFDDFAEMMARAQSLTGA